MIEPRPELSKLSDYVPGKSIEEIRAQYGLTEVVKLASNENPLGPSPKAKEAYLKIVDTLHMYPRGNAPTLLNALKDFYGVSSKQIIIGNGSDEIIDMVGKAFIRQGDNCLSITPTFSVYKFTTLSNGGDFIGVGEGTNKTPLTELLKAINEKTRVIFICSPNNPTGEYYTGQELKEFLDQVPKNILVFLDQAYSEFATASDYPQMFDMLNQYPHLLINRTFSKIYGLAGLRLGYGVSSQQVIQSMWKIKPAFDVNLVAQEVAIAALQDVEHVKRTQELNKAGIKTLSTFFEQLGFQVLPTQGNFICVHIGSNAPQLVKYLEERGMIIRGLTSFGLPEHVRITIGKPEENQFLMALVEKWIKEKP